MTRTFRQAPAEGRISYGHLGRTSLLSNDSDAAVQIILQYGKLNMAKPEYYTIATTQMYLTGDLFS